MPIFGYNRAIEIALKYKDDILNTNNWENNYEEEYGDDIETLLREQPSEVNGLSMLVWPLLDDENIIEDLKNLGYDGAIYGGYGHNRPNSLDDIEYRIFDRRQILSAYLIKN